MVRKGERKKMLLGNFLARLDLKKGRTALPKSFRKLLGEKVIITAGFDNSLMIIGQSNWQKVVGEVINKPFVMSPARQTDRFLLGNAFEIKLDSQGRFIIPPALRSLANLSQDIVFVGMGNRVEVWDQEGWAKQQQYLKENIETIAQKLNEQN